MRHSNVLPRASNRESAMGPVGTTGSLAGTTTAILVLLAGAPPAGAQCDPTTEQQRFSLTIDTEQKIYDLEMIRQQIENDHHVLVMFPGGVVLVTPQQAGTLFGNAVFQGALDPDSISNRIRELNVMTGIYLRDYIIPDLDGARACLEKLKKPLGSDPPTPPPGPPSAAATPIDWPVPMDWIAVKGSVRGSYVAECSGYRDYPAFRSAGTWRLEFLGDGKVRGVFGDDARQYSGLGEIKADGSTSGLSRSSNEEVPHLSWSAQFERSGVNLLIASHKLDLMAPSRGIYSILVECKPGYMRQE